MLVFPIRAGPLKDQPQTCGWQAMPVSRHGAHFPGGNRKRRL